MSTTLIQGGSIITMGPAGVLQNGYLLIEDSRIIALGTDLPTDLRPDRTLNASGMVITPGLIDSHFHTCQQLERGLLARVNAAGLFRNPVWAYILIPWESLLTQEDIRLSALAAYTDALRSGTTCIAEHGGRHPEILAQSIETVGLRGLLAMSTMDMDPTGLKLPSNMIYSTKEALELGTELVTRYPFNSESLVRGVYSLRQIIVCTAELIAQTIALAEEHQTMVQTHANEGHYEVDYARNRYNLRPAEYLASIGGLSQRVIAAHSVLLSENEVELFAKHGVKVAHCPRGNFASLGPGRLPLFRRLGVTIGLGSDGAFGGNIDLFEAMRISLVCQRLAFGSSFLDPSVATPTQMLEMATIGSARTIGLDHEIGSLEVGKRADLIILKPSLSTLPGNGIDNLVTTFSSRNVHHVFVNGRQVITGGEITTIDENALTTEVAQRVPVLQDRFLQHLHRSQS